MTYQTTLILWAYTGKTHILPLPRIHGLDRPFIWHNKNVVVYGTIRRFPTERATMVEGRIKDERVSSLFKEKD